MASRYSRKVIDEACWVASAINSNAFQMPKRSDDLRVVMASLGASEEARELYATAWLTAYATTPPGLPDTEVEAEAECMLRTGWLPERGTN